MKPSQVARTLRRIASRIDKSYQPSRHLVAKDLKRIVVAMKDVDDIAYEQISDELFETLLSGTFTEYCNVFNEGASDLVEVKFNVTFQRIDELTGFEDGDKADLSCTFTPINPAVPVPTMKLDLNGTWDGAGILQGTRNLTPKNPYVYGEGGSQYFSVHVNSVIHPVYNKISNKVNAQLDAEGYN